MSTKFTILCEDGIEVFEESTEPKTSIFGKYLGDNIYIVLEAVKRWHIDENGLTINIPDNEFLNNELFFSPNNIAQVYSEYSDLIIVLKGGSYSAKQMKDKNFDYFIKK